MSLEGWPLVVLGAEERQFPVAVHGLRRSEPNRMLGRYNLRQAH